MPTSVQGEYDRMSRILLVEDDTATRVLWEHALLDADYEIDTAETATGGVALVGSRHYDLVVTDGRLPDGIGMMVADAGRAKGIPALLVTGYAFILDELRGDPSHNVLVKPICPSELLEAVARALSTTPASDFGPVV
jgi:two-component system response regulator PilR (NtrC family)